MVKLCDRPIVAVTAALLFAVGSLLAASAHAQAPTTMNYQGRLLQNTAEQEPVGTTVDVVFSIWSGPSSDPSAVQLWTETWNGVALSNGIFSVLLGSNGSPLDPADFQGDSSLYLQLEVDGETLSPRQQLGSAPFAIVDEPANELQELSLDGNTLSLSVNDSSVDLSTFVDTDEQDLSLAGNSLTLTGDPTPAAIDLSSYLDNTDSQSLSLSGNTLSLTDGGSVSLASYLDDTDDQTLSLSGSTLSLTDGGSVNLSSVNTDEQDLSLSGTTLSLTNGGSVNLSGFLDNTDAQNLSNVLAQGNDAGNRNITNVATLTATGLDCPNCVDSADIAQDTIRGNDINDNIYILHIDCNGNCADMSMREACDVIENLRGLSTHVELIGVSCVHRIPSTSGNGFVPCNDGTQDIGDNDCRAFNLRTLGDIPCIDGDGTDALVTCLETDIAK
jgi:hypothetical protein